MEVSSLIKKLLLIGVVAIGMFIFWFWWALYRTQSTSIAKQTQYAEIIGTEVIAVHESFIALNYKHFAKENPYLLQMHRKFYEGSGKIYTLPIGTKFKIEDAKSFHNPVSGFSTNYLLGSIFIEALGKEVKFEVPWGYSGISALSDQEPFDLFEIMPWLAEAPPYKFYYDGRKEPHDWPPRITDYEFNIAAKHRFINKDSFQKRSFDSFYVKDEDWDPDKVYFGVHNVFEAKEIETLKFAEVYPDYKSNPEKYTFHPDYSLELSDKYVTLIVQLFIGKHEMESRLINYDLDGKIMGHLKIAYDEIAEGMTKKEALLFGNTISINDIISLDTEMVTTTKYNIEEDGQIKVISDKSTE